jgi:DDE family transposase
VERLVERQERSVFSSPVAGKAVRAAFDGGRLTSDAGVLLLAEIERRLGIAERLALCLADPRSPERIHHTLADMIRFRVLLIAAGYPDANDCDALRADRRSRWRSADRPRAGRPCARSRPCAGSRTCPPSPRSSA